MVLPLTLTHVKTLDIFPDGYKKSKKVIRISGTKNEFDAFLDSFVDFKVR